jgi:hypothetical protein
MALYPDIVSAMGREPLIKLNRIAAGVFCRKICCHLPSPKISTD